MTREERLDWLCRLRSDISYMDFSIDLEVSLERKRQYRQALSETIKALEQEPKTGHWYRKYAYGNLYCSECNHEYLGLTCKPKFCEECGAKMESEE